MLIADRTPKRHVIIGCLAAAVTVLASAAWQLSTRRGVTTAFGPWELAFLRYVIPGVFMGLLLGPGGWKPASVPWPRLLMLVGGGGAPFGLFIAVGARFAPAAHMSIFLAGTIPLFTAFAAWLAYRETLAAGRVAGLFAILFGIGVLVSNADEQTFALGDIAFLGAAACWAIHTIAFRACGLEPVRAVMLVNFWSAVYLVPAVCFFGDFGRIARAPLPDLMVQVMAQTLLGGLVGPLMYMIAVKHLGGSRASLSAALPPVMAGLGAQWLLGEQLQPSVVAAMIVVVAGVVLASGVLRKS
ncbi:MAG: DMT family transporter [Pseudomonadota bacterium]